MEEIKVKEIRRYEHTHIGKLATLLGGAKKPEAYGINIRLFRTENENYMILVNDISISCDTEENVFSAVHQILLNIENTHQQGIIPVITKKDDKANNQEEIFSLINQDANKIRLNVEGEDNRTNPQVHDAKIEELLISGQSLQKTEVLVDNLIKRATVSYNDQGEDIEAVDFNIERKFKCKYCHGLYKRKIYYTFGNTK